MKPVEELSNDQLLQELVTCYSNIVLDCCLKCRSEKLSDLRPVQDAAAQRLKFVQDAAQRLTTAIQTNVNKAFHAEKYSALLTYVTEISWSLLYRAVEILGFNNTNICILRSDLILLQQKNLTLSFAKGLEMSTMCLTFALRTSKTADAKDFALSWDHYLEIVLQERMKIMESFTVLEMQRICLLYCECSAHSAALSITEEDMRVKWSTILPIVAAGSNLLLSWMVMHAVVSMEIQSKDVSSSSSSQSSKKAMKSKACKNSSTNDTEVQSRWRCALDSLITKVRADGLQGVQAIDFELLSKAVCQAVEVDVDTAAKHDTCTDDISQYQSLADILLDAIQSSCHQVFAPIGDRVSEDMSKYVTFLSRTYSACLTWLQKHFQCKKVEKECQSSSVIDIETCPTPATIAVRIVRCILQSLSECTVWLSHKPALLGVLRGVGNCLSHLPSHCYEEKGTLDSSPGVSIMLSECVCAVLGRLHVSVQVQGDSSSPSTAAAAAEHSQDIISTCVMLASLVGGKYLGKKLFISSAHVSVSVIKAVYTAASTCSLDLNIILTHQDSILNSSTDTAKVSKSAISTADTGAINRVLLNLTAACVLGFFDSAMQGSIIKSADSINRIADSGEELMNGIAVCSDGDTDGDDDGGDVYYALLQSCQPILETVYAEEFVYTVCSDVLTRICSMRPSQVTAAGDSASALFDAATLFISNLFSLATAQNVRTVHTKDEISLVSLYFQSHILWGGGAGAVTPGVSNALSAAIIGALKELGQDIDANSMDNVAVVKGKSRSKRVTKVERILFLSTAHPLEDSIWICAENLRTWILLAQWGLPLSVVKEDVYMSDGVYGVSVYLSNALKALREVADNVSKLNSRGAISMSVCGAVMSAGYTLAADAKALYYMLGLSGRVREQIDVTVQLQMCSGVFTSICCGPKSHSMQKDYYQTLNELLVMNEIHEIWSGEGNQADTVHMSAQEGKGGSSSVYRTAARLRVLPSDSSDSDGDLVVTVALRSPLSRPVSPCTVQSESEDDALWQVVRESRGLLQCALQGLGDHSPTSPKTLISTIKKDKEKKRKEKGREEGSIDGNSCVQYEASVEQLLSSSRSNPNPNTTTTTTTSYLTPAMKAWVALLCTKTILYVTGDHQRAYKWVRRALSFLIPPRSSSSTSSPTSTRPASTNIVGEGGSCLSVDRCMPKLEGVLLSAELYEQTGDTDSCISYIIEATAIGKASPIAMRNIASLHSMRLWHRLGSARFISALNDVGDETADEYSPDVSKDDVSKKVRAASKELSRLLQTEDQDDPLDSEVSEDGTAHTDALTESESESETTMDSRALSYRHLSCNWDSRSKIRTSAFQKKYHTYLSMKNRHLMALAADMTGSSAAFTEQEQDGRQLSPVQELLRNLKNSKAFDLVRDIRRMGCLESLHLPAPTIPPPPLPVNERTVCDAMEGCGMDFVSFVLGASSCGTALESVLERPAPSHAPSSFSSSSSCPSSSSSFSSSSSSSSTSTSSATSSSSSSSTSSSSPTPFSSSIQGISGMLAAACCNDKKALNDVANILKHRFKINPNGGDAVCFAAIEPVTKQLLLGRWDETGSSVSALPIACELNALMMDWTACMEASKTLLHRTVDTAQVAKWTDSDRRAWWSERASSDAQIESLLFKLEALLGPLKCLLSGGKGVPVCDGAMGKQKGVFTPDPNRGCDQTEKPFKKNSKNSNPDEIASKMADEDLLDALNALKVTELRQQLKESKLSVIGKKSELISRIQEFKSKNKSRSLDVCMYEDPQSIIVRSVNRPDASISSSGDVESQPVGPKVGKKVNIKVKPAEDKGVDVEVEARNAELIGTNLNGLDDTALGHTVLILDETLQQIPWEVLPCLRSRVCSRMPSFALLLHMLTRHHNPQTSHTSAELSDPDTARSRNDHADLGPPCRNMPSSRTGTSSAVRTSSLQHTWYVLDPEGNLPATRATMSAFLQPYVEQYGWTGYTGEIPSEEAAKTLHNDSDLFIYCGHGAGEKICDTHKMRKWSCPSAILWGCSSGRLSVQGVHDPQGVPVNYIIGGAGYVIANLWDVTDKDIDKLSIHCMQKLFTVSRDPTATANGTIDGTAPHVPSMSPAEALTASRDVCKLKNAVGSAPVVYGLPPLLH